MPEPTPKISCVEFVAPAEKIQGARPRPRPHPHPRPGPEVRPRPVPVPVPPTPLPTVPPGPGPDMGAVVAIINRERAARGLAAVSVNPLLMNAALIHSQDMAIHNNMTHDGSDGSKPADRMASQGYHYSYAGEIIAFGVNLSEADVVRLWINSPPHYAIMFSVDYVDIGAGYAVGPPLNGFICGYYTVDFGKAM